MMTMSVAASSSYYLNQMASYYSPMEYFHGGQEPDGTWWNPAGLLGLEDGDDVEPVAFQRVFAGLSPDDATALTRNADSEGRCSALDLTFSADKSVSALWALADGELREQIKTCHQDAVRWTLDTLVRKHCGYTRCGAGGRDVVTGDIFAAMFDHHISRENDPQIHTHCTLFNLVRTHHDGKWRSLYQLIPFKWKLAAGAVYRNAIAWYLQERLGLPVERYGHDNEFVRVVGLPEDLLANWSKRRHSIEQRAGEMGFTTADNQVLAQALTLATRTSKDALTPDERDAAWREEASRFVDIEALIAEIRSAAITAPSQEQIQDMMRRCRQIPGLLTTTEATFNLPGLIDQVARESATVVNPEALDTIVTQVLREASVLTLDERKGTAADVRARLPHTQVYTTFDYAAEELAVHAATERSQHNTGHAIPKDTIDRRLDALTEQGFPIGAQQRHAVHHLAGGDTSLAVCLGAAGSGKTVALRPVADLYRERGDRVIATALSWRAAVNLGTECDIQPYSLARLFRDVRKGRVTLDASTVVMVDEAGMLSVREMRTVLEMAERAGAKVLCIGDLDQLQPIEAGPGLRLIVDELDAARIETIHRQRPGLEDLVAWRFGYDPAQARAHVECMAESEREALLAQRGAFTGQGWQALASQAIRQGNAGDTIDAYAERGQITLGTNIENTVQRLANDWMRDHHEYPDASRLVIARTNKEVNALNQVLRTTLHPPNIPRPSVTVTTGRGRPGRHKTAELEIAQGDRIRIGATVWDHQLFNGTILTVDRIETVRDPELERDRVRIKATTELGRQLTFHADEVHDLHGNIRIDYGYALTIASAQGSTADRVFFLGDDRPSRETIYPALTRHRDRLDIYLDAEPLTLEVRKNRNEEDWNKHVSYEEIYTHLAYRWGRAQPKEAAYDYASPELRSNIEARIADEEARRSMRHLSETLRAKRPAPEGVDVPQGLEDRVLTRLTRNGGAFTRDDVRRALYVERVDFQHLAALERQVLSDPRVMQLYHHDATFEAPRYTTVETFAAEEQLTRLAKRLHGDNASHPAPPLERHVERHTRHLDPDTAGAARAILNPGRLNVLAMASDRDRARALQAAIRAYTRAGTHVLACGPSTRSLRDYEKAPADQYTVNRLLRRIEQGKSPLQRTSVVIVNDAEALDTEDLHTLARLTHAARVRLVLVGDPRNPCRSPAFAWLAAHCAPAGVELRSPRHVPEPLRQHTGATFDPKGLLKQIHASGRLHRADDPTSLTVSIVRAWMENEAVHPEDTQLVLTPNAADADATNLAIQRARANAGRLGPSQRYTVVRPAYTAPESPGVSSEAIARVDDTTESLTVHVGDRLRILENHREAGLSRGDVGTVLSVTPRRIRLRVNGKVHSFDPGRFNRFALGYAASVHQQSSSADHVHATVSGLSRPATLFRAATSHDKTLNLHWHAVPGQTVDDLASAIAARAAPSCTQFYADRQHVLNAAHLAPIAGDDTHRRLRTAWQLLSAEDRAAVQREDREQRASIHAYQRPNDDTPSWLRTAPPASVASAIRTAMRYRSEGAAALDYQYQYDVLNAELADITHQANAASRPALDDARYPDVLNRLQSLTDQAAARVEASNAFRLAFPEKTRFVLEDLERHREDCAHELRAHHIHVETRNMAAYFHTRARAWTLAVASVLDEGASLSGTARVLNARPWFLDDYPEWYRGVRELEHDHAALVEVRGKLPADDPADAELLAQFDAASKRLSAVVAHHEREARAAELVGDYASLRAEHTQQQDTLYRYEHTRSGTEHREAEKALEQLGRRFRAAAAAVEPILEWAKPHLERASVTDREIEVFATSHRDPNAFTPERSQKRDIDISF